MEQVLHYTSVGSLFASSANAHGYSSTVSFCSNDEVEDGIAHLGVDDKLLALRIGVGAFGIGIFIHGGRTDSAKKPSVF